jgi:two-component system, sensor histidine kinase and response regulator
VAALAPLPLLGLVALFARERRQRLESLIELNGAYRRARDEAIEASNLKSAFLRNVSHEIRTPMNGVLGMNELLLTTNLTDEQRAYAQQVEASGEHMLAVINDILDISKIESGRIDLDPVDFDLRETVEQACAPADLEAHAKGLELNIEIDRRAPEIVRGDRARVRQVLMNLAGNAVKFTAKGTATVRVAPTGQGHIRFEVTDTGVGIEAQLIERMFEPFVQADVSTTREFGGNGLGLAIAKELVELMGGAIGATSEVGVGSTFWFELPLPPVAAAPPPSPRDDPNHLRVRRVEPDAALVLIVEDSPVNRLVAAHVLERLGYRSHVVNDGREALQALASQHYDAVLMDCQMPDIDGYEATRELRRREQGLRRTPVIAMTAHAMTGDRAKCLEAGMDDYITKPVRSQTLADVLRRWIEASQARSAGSSPGVPTARGRRTLAERAAARAHTIGRH